MRTAFIAVMLLATTSASTLAAEASSKAEAHFAAITSADVAKITSDYSDKAVFQWIGGPLDGVYTTPGEIKEVWTKFVAAQGKLDVEVKGIEEAVNPKGATVTANVVFKGKAPIPVRYVLTYRDGKLVNEIWQVNPPKN